MGRTTPPAIGISFHCFRGVLLPQRNFALPNEAKLSRQMKTSSFAVPYEENFIVDLPSDHRWVIAVERDEAANEPLCIEPIRGRVAVHALAHSIGI